MKTNAILFVILFIGFSVTAQKQHNAKATTAPIAYLNSNQAEKYFELKSKQTPIKSGKELVRLYKYKNSRVKKALSFTTPRDKSKLV